MTDKERRRDAIAMGYSFEIIIAAGREYISMMKKKKEFQNEALRLQKAVDELQTFYLDEIEEYYARFKERQKAV
jgi:hypothetical protein